jgi:hypothetical protein
VDRDEWSSNVKAHDFQWVQSKPATTPESRQYRNAPIGGGENDVN